MASNWAYWAGLFDGEGCVRTEKSVRISISNTNKEIMEKLCDEFPGSTYHKNNVRPRICWEWRMGGQKSKDFLLNILPYSIIKKAQILVALTFPIGKSNNPVLKENKVLRRYIKEELKRLKRV